MEIDMANKGKTTNAPRFGDDARARFAGKNYVSDSPKSGGGVQIATQCRPNSAARGQAYSGDDLRPERMVKSRPSSHEDFESREKVYPRNGRQNEKVKKGRG